MADPQRPEDRAELDPLPLLTRADDLLGQLEAAPGPTARTALEAVRVLTELYGEALARTLEATGPAVAERLADDELVGHLLALHGIHPEPVERRVARAVDAIRPAVRERGGELRLAGIADGVATVRLKTSGCRSSATGLADAVREAVLALAPELSDVRQADEERPGAFVPLDAVRTRPATAGRPL
ncbi:NifU family protein [Streptomyces hesseae]|uniref:NifU family protein n=1 Tax=Streptomyces hesseae TaxID=3075519 RepID=A0ABU2SL43_9ACTN|nr:NifU family protein [Streptomyces sp. DSM 40473]MDT0448500.1 NifU family protein [Streptomyces sp. DSM 40473]